jgi:hypothetical protein
MNIFVAKNFFLNSPFNTQTMHIKSFYTQQHCYVSLKTLYPGGIWTRVFLFLRQMQCPLCHASRTIALRTCWQYSHILVPPPEGGLPQVHRVKFWTSMLALDHGRHTFMIQCPTYVYCQVEKTHFWPGLPDSSWYNIPKRRKYMYICN